MTTKVFIEDDHDKLLLGPLEAATICENNHKHLSDIANAMHKSKRCVVITGAGISVSGGIPVSALYHNLPLSLTFICIGLSLH